MMNARVIFTVFGFAFVGAVQANGSALCSSLPVRAQIVGDVRHILMITVENPTSHVVALDASSFGENLLRFSGVEKTGERPLKVVVPLLSPGVEPLRIPAHDKIVKEIRLDVIFPDLSATLKRSSVDISWKLNLRPNDGCFSEEVSTTMTLFPR